MRARDAPPGEALLALARADVLRYPAAQRTPPTGVFIPAEGQTTAVDRGQSDEPDGRLPIHGHAPPRVVRELAPYVLIRCGQVMKYIFSTVLLFFDWDTAKSHSEPEDECTKGMGARTAVVVLTITITLVACTCSP